MGLKSRGPVGSGTGKKILLEQHSEETRGTGSGHKQTCGVGLGTTGQNQRFLRGVLVGEVAGVTEGEPVNICDSKGGTRGSRNFLSML